MARNVGEVFVTVLANTKVFERQVENAARDAADSAGASIDRRLTNAFRDAAQKWSRDNRLNTLADQTGAQIARRFGLGFDKGIERVRLTDTVGRELDQLAKESGESFEDLLKQVVSKIGPAYERELRKIVAEAEAENRRRTTQIAAEERASQRAREQAERSLARQIGQTGRLADSTREVSAAVDAVARARRTSVEIGTTELKVYQEQERALKASLQVLERNQRAAREAVQGLRSNLDVDIDRRGGLFSSFSRGLNNLRLSLRRAGTGGAFDTLTNILGAGVGFVRVFSRLGATLATFPAKALFNISDGIQSLASRGIISSTGTLAKFGTVLARLAPIAGKIGAVAAPIAGFIGAFAGLATITKVAGVFSSLLTSVVGIITLFAQQLTYAAASLAAFIPLIAALPVAAGAIILGFKGVPKAIGAFNDVLNATNAEERAEALEKYSEALGGLQPNAKKAVQALEPLIESFKETQKIVQDNIFAGLDEEIKGLQGTFGIVEKGLQDTATTINGVFRNISQELQSPAFKTDLSNVFTGLQPIIEDLGNAIGDFFAGFTGLIDALIPSGERLSGAIERGAAAFKEFTQSAEGKNAIETFMLKAQEAAGTLWEILRTIGSAIGGIFGAAEEEGKGFLGDVLAKAQEFKAWVDERVADGRLEAWFGDVRDIAGELWGVVENVVGVIDRLDTPENRDALKGLLRGFQDFLGFIEEDFIPAMETVWDWIEPAFGLIGDIVAPLVDGFQAFLDFINGEGWQNLAITLVSPFQGLLEVASRIPGIGGMFQPALAALDMFVGGVQESTYGLEGDLLRLQESGALTAQQIELLTGPRDLPEWPLSMQDNLFDLLNSGDLTFGKFNEILAGRDIPGWSNDFAGNLFLLWEEGDLALGKLLEVLADQNVPTWAKSEYITALGDIASKGDLTDAQMQEILGNKSLPSWVRSELIARLDDNKRKAGSLDGALETATRDRTSNIIVNTRQALDAIALTNARLQGIKDRYVSVFVTEEARDRTAATRGAAGGLFTNATNMIIGEAGPEALIPLTRPLSQVDPSVRDLAALIRGKAAPSGASPAQVAAVPQGKTGPSKTVNVTMNVTPTSADPEAVASSVLNRSVALARL